MRPGLLAAGGLVLLATLKELPATLLLAPIGTRTLATRVWSAFEEGFLTESALAAIAYLLLAAAAFAWIAYSLKRERIWKEPDSRAVAAGGAPVLT